MKRLLLSLIVLISLLGQGICQSDTQKQLDYLIGEFNRYKDIKPYEKGLTILYNARSKARALQDKTPYVIIICAQLEYMDKYNLSYPPGDDEKVFLYLINERYDRKQIDATYRNSMIYIRTKLRRMKYIEPKYIPDELMEIAEMLDKCPPYEEESKYTKYYDIIPKKITKSEKEELYTFISDKAKEYDGEFWAYEGLMGFLHGKSQQHLDKCLQYADISNKPAADGTRYFIQDAKKSGTPEERQKLFDSALQGGSVFVTIMAADRMKSTKADEAMALLESVENSNLFTDYGGDAIKAAILGKRRTIADLQQASLLLQKCMKSCKFKATRKKAKNLYDKLQTDLALLSLKEQEEMIDPYDALPAEYAALAAGYENLKGYEDKAIQFYRIAAKMGDLRSICRIAIDDIKNGILENDPDKAANAAKIILDNSQSHFLPFKYNAACVILYGLDGNEPNHKKAEKIFSQFENEFENSSTSNSYVKQDFLGEVMTLPRLPKLDFYESDEAILHYNEGLEYEELGKYQEAENAYRHASFFGHPTAIIKAERMENLRREIKKQTLSKEK